MYRSDQVKVYSTNAFLVDTGKVWNKYFRLTRQIATVQMELRLQTIDSVIPTWTWVISWTSTQWGITTTSVWRTSSRTETSLVEHSASPGSLLIQVSLITEKSGLVLLFVCSLESFSVGFVSVWNSYHLFLESESNCFESESWFESSWP